LQKGTALLNRLARYIRAIQIARVSTDQQDAAREEGPIGGRLLKLSEQHQYEIRTMITKGDKTAADAAWLFKVHPATLSRLLALASSRKGSRAK